MLDWKPTPTQRWPVYAVYAVDGDFVWPSGARHLYQPTEYPNLPYDLAKVDSERAAIRFFREYGTLYVQDGGPLELRMIFEHASTMRSVLHSQQVLNEGDDRAVERFVQECAPFQPVPGLQSEEPLSLLGWKYAAGPQSRRAWYGEVPIPGIVVRLRGMIRTTINDNLGRVAPALEPSQEADPSPTLTLRWRSLYEVIWWHAAVIISRTADIATCEECGSLYERTKSGQRFCPPTPEQRAEAASGRGRAQSRCAVRARNRRYIARRRGE